MKSHPPPTTARKHLLRPRPLMNMQMRGRRRSRPALYSSPSQLTRPPTGNKMAAAGPSTRASSAAAAAALSRRSRRGRCDEMAAAKTGAQGRAAGPTLLVLPQTLLQPPPRSEEPGCAGCLETPGEAAALPCGHSRCRGCAQRAGGAAGPACPRCRARGPGWARRRTRDDGQASAEVPGERARRQPERCRQRRDGGAAASGPRPEPEPRAAPAEPGGASLPPLGVRGEAWLAGGGLRPSACSGSQGWTWGKVGSRRTGRGSCAPRGSQVCRAPWRSCNRSGPPGGRRRARGPEGRRVVLGGKPGARLLVGHPDGGTGWAWGCDGSFSASRGEWVKAMSPDGQRPQNLKKKKKKSILSPAWRRVRNQWATGFCTGARTDTAAGVPGEEEARGVRSPGSRSAAASMSAAGGCLPSSRQLESFSGGCRLPLCRLTSCSRRSWRRAPLQHKTVAVASSRTLRHTQPPPLLWFKKKKKSLPRRFSRGIIGKG